MQKWKVLWEDDKFLVELRMWWTVTELLLQRAGTLSAQVRHHETLLLHHPGVPLQALQMHQSRLRQQHLDMPCLDRLDGSGKQLVRITWLISLKISIMSTLRVWRLKTLKNGHGGPT